MTALPLRSSLLREPVTVAYSRNAKAARSFSTAKLWPVEACRKLSTCRAQTFPGQLM